MQLRQKAGGKEITKQEKENMQCVSRPESTSLLFYTFSFVRDKKLKLRKQQVYNIRKKNFIYQMCIDKSSMLIKKMKKKIKIKIKLTTHK